MTSSIPPSTDFHEFGSRVQRLPSRESGTNSKSCTHFAGPRPWRGSATSGTGRRALVLLLLLALALPALGACGRKGPPEPPEGSTYPKQYPEPTYQ